MFVVRCSVLVVRGLPFVVYKVLFVVVRCLLLRFVLRCQCLLFVVCCVRDCLRCAGCCVLVLTARLSCVA